MTRKDENCGISRWDLYKRELNNLSPEEFKATINKIDCCIIVDCCKPSEYEAGHLPEAINLNYLSQTLAEDLKQLNKEQAHFVYCQSGRRSLRVCMLMKNSGFKEVYNLDGGLQNWLTVFNEI